MKKTLYQYCIENQKTELLQQWDTEKNGDLTPHDVTYGSGKKVWWRCEQGHSWQATVNSRKSGAGCPVCTGRTPLAGSNDLATDFPELAKQWHPTKNLPLEPSQFTKGSHRMVWWQCQQGHEWRAMIKSRVEGCGCPVCAGRKLQVGENDLATVRPSLAAQWHKEKNGTLRPNMVLSTTMRRVWWQCEKGHEWQARVKDRMDGTGCPICGGQKVQAGENDLASKYPYIAAQWHPTKNGKLTPQDVVVSSNKRVWWRCEQGHDWQAPVYSRTIEQTGCPYCANRKVWPGFNDLATVNPKLAAQWHPTLNGTLTPQQVTVGSKRKVWWICEQGHVWKTAVYVRRKSGCPVCAGNVSKKKRSSTDAAIDTKQEE